LEIKQHHWQSCFGTLSRPKTLENPESLTDTEAAVKLRDDTVMTIPRYAFDELKDHGSCQSF